ncbi:hypothetical protein DFR67_104149 [Williamsia limnetica]|jgi:hypothetical protein|uniref:IrrE N-terminal-like domain-containing protein n=1 Tax=Williamsia limnetica TaxID=882452 RepID=A0A318RPK2_WILLI|nr:hypothetical protein [Williamsia limnetica]PYE18570.1 hypothetical protein DFR67_104149 [Williamsia limnetica]
MRSERILRALCRRELADLELDLPLDAEQLCARYGDKRGRAIKILAHPLPAGTPNGVWLMADDADYFFYQANTTKLHRDQIVIHEFGHLIAGHQILGTPGSLLAAGAPDEGETSEALSRTCYSDEREWEAEMLATIIREWAAKATQGVGQSAKHDGLRGIQSILGGHSGWL